MCRLYKLSLLLFVLFVVGSSSAKSVLAYAAYGPAWPADSGCVGLCSGEPRTIRYTLGNITDGSILKPDGSPLPAPYIKASIEEALRVWTTAVNINFVEVPEGPLTQLSFRHVYINGPDPLPPADPIAKAQATCLGYGSGCAVEYDHSDRWQEVGTTPNPDILGATIHEVGHIIGLYHTDVTGADISVRPNMYWIFHRFSGLGTGRLFDDDIAGIQSLYGAGVGGVTPVPEPAAGFLIAAAVMFAFPVRRR